MSSATGPTRVSEVERLILSLFAGRGDGAPGTALSGETIASAIGISRTAVWKHIGHLRNLGYGIEGTPSSGYSITYGPVSLIPFELEAACDSAGVSRYCTEVVHYDSVISTNDIAKQLAAGGAPQGTIVVAEEQSGGRGRRGRAWASPRGGIWFSLILRPQVLPANVPLITLASAVATVLACRQNEQLLGPMAQHVTIKWPNDILLGEKKLGGILCEMAAQPDGVDWVVIGIGLNIGIDSSQIPGELSQIAACLPLSGSAGSSKAILVASILKDLELLVSPERYGDLLDPDLIEQWGALSSTIGRKVHIPSSSVGKPDAYGVAEGIDADGSLVVMTDWGEIIRCSAGDIVHLSGEELTRGT